MPSHITVRLAGGAGNQLFQILSGLLLASRLGVTQVRLSTAALGHYAMSREAFVSEPLVCADIELSPTDEVPARLIELMLRAVERVGWYGLHARLMSHSGVVAGYCQHVQVCEGSVRWIHLLREVMHARLASRDIGLPREQAILPVALHIRGGDALLPENANRYALSAAYYRQVSALGLGDVGVFSDDPGHARCVMSDVGDPSWRYVDTRCAEDYLAAAMQAQVMVLSRSTLSFWAGLLSPAESMVIPLDYPRVWVDWFTSLGKSMVVVEDR